MLKSGPDDLQRGIIKFVPELHAHLWKLITVDGQTYANDPALID